MLFLSLHSAVMIHGYWHCSVADIDEVMEPASELFAAMEFTARLDCVRSVTRRRSRPKCYCRGAPQKKIDCV